MESDHLATWNTFQYDLRRFVYSRVKDKALTDDIVQDVFIKIYEKIDSVRDTAKLRSWLFTLTNRTIIDHFRRANRGIDPHEYGVMEETTNFNDCVSGYMKKLVSTLPEKYKEAILLTELGSMSQIRMAEHLGISVSGAKSRVQRGRALLKKRLLENLEIETDRYGNVLTCACPTPLACQ